MSLLTEIQEALLREGSSIGAVLLKTKFLAQRLGVTEFEDWVKHELDGYSGDAQVPEYRVAPVSYTGLFVSYTVQGILPIAPYYIEKYAGKQWIERPLRQSISEIDAIIRQGAAQVTNTEYRPVTYPFFWAAKFTRIMNSCELMVG